MKEASRGHCEIAELFAQRLGFPAYVQRTVRFQWERWDGKGLAYGLKGTEVPVTARILQAALALELANGFGGPAAARALAREQRGARFDPEVVDAFLTMEKNDFSFSTRRKARGRKARRVPVSYLPKMYPRLFPS